MGERRRRIIRTRGGRVEEEGPIEVMERWRQREGRKEEDACMHVHAWRAKKDRSPPSVWFFAQGVRPIPALAPHLALPPSGASGFRALDLNQWVAHKGSSSSPPSSFSSSSSPSPYHHHHRHHIMIIVLVVLRLLRLLLLCKGWTQHVLLLFSFWSPTDSQFLLSLLSDSIFSLGLHLSSPSAGSSPSSSPSSSGAAASSQFVEKEPKVIIDAALCWQKKPCPHHQTCQVLAWCVVQHFFQSIMAEFECSVVVACWQPRQTANWRPPERCPNSRTESAKSHWCDAYWRWAISVSVSVSAYRYLFLLAFLNDIVSSWL